MVRRLRNLFRRRFKPTIPGGPTLDEGTLALLEPGRAEFRAMHPRGPRALTIDRVPDNNDINGEDDEREPFDTITLDAASATRNRTALGPLIAWAAAHVRVGGTVEIEVLNALVAATVDIGAGIDVDADVGVTPDELTALITVVGLTTDEAYGIGYVPQSLARGEPCAMELARNPGVYATPTDCVLLAYRCRKPIDARA